MTTMTPDRQTFRATVAEVAARAKEKLPQAVNGRVESAVALVLHGDVEPQVDGSIVVYSATDATRRYVLQGACCTCTDYTSEKAPQGWCKHRIAAGIHKRVQELLPDSDTAKKDVTISAPLPEAPASANVRVLIAGHEVQVTLRDQSEEALFQRLQAVLKRSDIRPIPKPQPRQKAWPKGR